MELLSIELASWATAWEHEARGYHGKWIKAGEGLDRYTVPDHKRLLLTDPQAVSNPRSLIDPADHPWFKAHPVSPANIIKSYDASTPAERAQGARWYADAHLIADKITNGNPTEGAILLASYSPQSSWPVNMFNAARSAEEHRALGKHDGMITGSMQANAQEALDGKSINDALTSPKIRAFARLIELGGDSPTDGAGEVVIDRHALNVAAGETLGKDETEKLPIGNPRVHEYIADQYRQAALDISKRDGKVMPPYELQAITWLHQQQLAQSMDEAATAATAARGGRNLAKGRVTALRNAWARWMKYAQAQGIPLDPGVTALALQIEEMLAIDLAHDAWRHELRDARGRWTRTPSSLAGQLETGKTDTQPLIDRIGQLRHDIDQSGDYVSAGSLDNAITALTGGDFAEAERQLRFAAKRRKYNGYKDDAARLDLLADAAHDASQGKPISDNAQHVNIDQVWKSIGNLADDAILVGHDDLSRDISVAQGALHGGTADDFAAAELYLDNAAKRAEILGYKGLAHGLRTQAGLVHAAKPELVSHSPVRSVQKFLAGQAVPALAKILGGTQSWNGNVTLVSRLDWPFTYGEMTWGRSMRLRGDIAGQVADDLANPSNPIHDPHSYDVILHELIHGVSNDPLAKDMDAYQDERVANLEEGFTELGATQHMAEFADAVGIGGRQAPGTGSMKMHYKVPPADRKHVLSMMSEAHNLQTASPAELNALDHASTAVERGDLDTALNYIDSAFDSYATSPDEKIRLRAIQSELNDLADKYLSASRPTVHQVAQARSTSEAIRDESGPWGHYPWQTAAAYAWVQKIAHEEGLKGAAQARRMIELSDEINREGSYSKSRIMANQVARTVKGLAPAKMTDTEWDSIIANIEEGFASAVGLDPQRRPDLDPVANSKFRAKIIAQKQQERERLIA